MSQRTNLLICGLVGLWATVGVGQEAKESSFRGRLPAHYGEIVTEEQRQKIYAVQEKYDKQISALEGQLEAAKKKREAEILDVLNEEQKKKLKKKQEDVATDRKKKAADAKKTGK